MKQFLSRYGDALMVCGCLLGFSLGLWIGGDVTHDFGLNLFTEVVGVAVTVFIIDRLITKRRQEEEAVTNLPRRQAVFEQARRFREAVIRPWNTIERDIIYRDTGDISFDQQNDDVLRSKANLDALLEMFKSEDLTAVRPKRTYEGLLYHDNRRALMMGNQFLDRYINWADATLYGHISTMVNSWFMIVHIVNHDQKSASGVSYRIKHDQQFQDAYVGLAEWCEREGRILEPEG